MLYRFGPFTLRESSCELERDGTPVPLRRQAFLVLCYLIAHRERLVKKRELFEAIWPHARVTDNALSQCLAEIRRALGDDGTGQRLIRTRHGVGFHFIADVAVQTEMLASEAPAPARASLVSVPVMLVLPFSIDGDQHLEAELGVEIEHELLRQLVKKSPIPVIQLRSLCRTATAASTPEAAAADLGAALLVEGRVQRFDECVRLRLRITDTATRVAIWSDRFDARISQLLDDEDLVARAAAEGLLRAAIQVLSRRFERKTPQELDDRELSIRGIEQFYRLDSQANRRAIEYLTELSTRGSQPLSVYAYLGRAHYRSIYYMWESDWASAIEQVEAAANECLRIDERDPAGRLLLAFTRLFEGDGEQAIALADSVVTAWPEMPEARCLHGNFMLLLGHCQDAIRAVLDAMRRKRQDAARGEYAAALSAAYFNSESYAEAREMAQRAIVDNPHSIMNHVVGAVSSWHLNDLAAVEIEVQRIRRLRPAFSHRPFAGLLASTPSKQRRHFLASLEQTGLIGPGWQDECDAAPQTYRRVIRPKSAYSS